MKKLILGLAVVAIATMSQAAVTKWNVMNVRTPVATDPTQAETGISAAATAALMQGILVELSYNGEVVASKPTNQNGMIMQEQFWDQATTIAKTQAAGTTTLSFDVAATYTATEGVYVYSGTVSANLGNVVSGAMDVGVPVNFGTAGTWSFTPSAVPEPTSGLLLLLGVAGLALRRRRA